MSFDDEQLERVIRAAMRERVVAGVLSIQAVAAEAIAAIAPICRHSGRCCHFAEYGHRLYITTAELAVLAMQLTAADHRPDCSPDDADGCRFQVGRACSVHNIRPLGCRLFFCDPTAEESLQQVYERTHRQIRDLHDEEGLEYRYVEWRVGLRALQGIFNDPHTPG